MKIMTVWKRKELSVSPRILPKYLERLRVGYVNLQFVGFEHFDDLFLFMTNRYNNRFAITVTRYEGQS